ncbi:MAG: site-specific DNA-methyltransferase [Planctomycetota bacterium]|nr:site-specific DNA-methyltransferase [Planctomycetota bacterium]
MSDATATLPAEHVIALTAIREADNRLHKRFADRMAVNQDLDRTLVSFQANKSEVRHRWCKYKEGFSAELVRYIWRESGITSGKILDPFAGSGTALFTASEAGLDAVGIELLDSSSDIIEVRKLAASTDQMRLSTAIAKFRERGSWRESGEIIPFPHLRITAGAFPVETEQMLGRYLADASRVGDATLARVLRFSAMCILEQISYTRKDGQYLRWDQRSGRCLGKQGFDKGKIYSFDEAITSKLTEIAKDLAGDGPRMLFDLRDKPVTPGDIVLLKGTCLEIMPSLEAKTFSGLITSPPYCNRYDYTRTYALELAMLGVGEEAIRNMRQTMLSCTVENREKHGLILSDFAEQAGFDVEAIWVLPRGKGNSSQQMGLHGREEIRKCVYVWRMPKGRKATSQGQ